MITPQQLLDAYRQGYFPMARGRYDSSVYWFNPEERGILPLDRFHVPRSLAKFMRTMPYRLTIDDDFPSVLHACAQLTETRDETWLNPELIQLYGDLHRMGYAHSVECWEGEEMAGGLYGVHLGSAFMGESMFSRKPNASKVALVFLAEHLKKQRFTLLDTQYVNEHLKQFGAEAISKKEYQLRLKKALRRQVNFL